MDKDKSLTPEEELEEFMLEVMKKYAHGQEADDSSEPHNVDEKQPTPRELREWIESIFKNADKADRELLTQYPVDDPQLLKDVVAENRLSFPIIIEAPDYPEPIIDEEELSKPSDYFEQNLAYMDALAVGDMEAVSERKFFHKISTAYKFNFRSIYFEAYNALKAYDKDNQTNLATLYIESLMSYGIRGSEESDNPIIQAVLSGAKFLISQERNKQEGTKRRNEKRSDDNKDEMFSGDMTSLM